MTCKRLFLILSIAFLELLAIILFQCKVVEFLDFIKDKKLQIIIPILLAAPIALLIWYWRDQNKRADIRNAEDTLQQHDFHKVIEWASDDKNDILQVAALKLLEPYTVGEYGRRFKDPAKAVYKTLLGK